MKSTVTDGITDFGEDSVAVIGLGCDHHKNVLFNYLNVSTCSLTLEVNEKTLFLV